MKQRPTFATKLKKKRKIRKNKANVEKKADRITKRKEEDRIKALKEHYPSIDPEDSFFHSAPIVSQGRSITEDTTTSLLGDNFGPALLGNTNPNPNPIQVDSTMEAKHTGAPVTSPRASRAPSISFRNACLHPDFAQRSSKKKAFDASNTDFPSLSSTPKKTPRSDTKAKPSWGTISTSPAIMRTQPRKMNSTANMASVLSLDHLKLGNGTHKRGTTKGKKVSLFSTGGQRGR